jgi:phosphonate transport system permease protein
MSTKLGIVGVGSIGFELITALRLTAHDQVAAILLTVLACAVALYSLGTILKRRLE